jgi:spore coat-associated protein N
MNIPGRKLAISILVAMMAVALAGTGALAFFQDTETSTGNTITAGTLDLKLADFGEGARDGVHSTWTMTNMAPGVSRTSSWYVDLFNSGSIGGGHVEINFHNEIDEGTYIESETNEHNSASDMAQWLQVMAITYTGASFTAFPDDGFVNTNDTPFIDLDDLANSLNAAILDNLMAPLPYSTVDSSGKTVLTMDVKFNSGAGNDFQGDTLITTVTFTLNQDASQ